MIEFLWEDKLSNICCCQIGLSEVNAHVLIGHQTLYNSPASVDLSEAVRRRMHFVLL